MMSILVLVAAMQTSVVNFELQKYDDVYRSAIGNQKPFLVVIGADWCPACQVLKRKTLPQVAGDGGLQGVKIAYVDFDRDKELAKKLMKGTRVPQILRFHHDGTEWYLTRLRGVPNQQTLAEFARVSKPRNNGDPEQRSPLDHVVDLVALVESSGS